MQSRIQARKARKKRTEKEEKKAMNRKYQLIIVRMAVAMAYRMINV